MQRFLFKSLGSAFISLVAVVQGCGTNEHGAQLAGEGDAATVVGAIAVELATALPSCTRAHRGAVYYVQSETRLYYCDGRRYRQLSLPRSGGSHSLCAVRPAGSEDCPNGGVEIAAGVDRDRDGTLDPSEVRSVEHACNGADGSSCSVTTDNQGVKTIQCTDGTSAVISDGMNGSRGVNFIVTVTAAPDGVCPTGGTTILTGPDADGDDVIDEVVSSQTICNGERGPEGPPGESSAPSLLRLTRFDAHPECPAGGVLAEAGRDSNENAVLDDAEVESAAPICDGEDALLERITVIESGDLCEFGGEHRERGFDSNGNGFLDDAEVLAEFSEFSCFRPGNSVAGAALDLGGTTLRGSDLTWPGPLLVRYTLAFDPTTGVDTTLLTEAARSALGSPLTPQSVRIGYAIDLLGAAAGAELRELNSGIEYLSRAGEHTDFRTSIQQRTAAVNVASANIPFPVTPPYAETLWNTILTRSLAAQSNLAASAAVDKGIVVVFVSGDADAQILETAYQGIDGMIRADTIAVLVVTEGNDADF